MTTDRDSRGHFQVGHRDFVKAAGVIAGRPRELKRQVIDALKIAQDAMPQIIADMITRAQDKDVPHNVRQAAAEYLIDRIYGKANQPLSGKDGAPLPVPTFFFCMPDGTRQTAAEVASGSSKSI